MNTDALKRESIYKGAALARGDGLSILYDLCEKQKTIGTKKVQRHIKRTHEFMKDCANHIQRLTDGMDFETKRLRRVAVLMGISVPESDEALRAAAGGVLGEIERAIERSFKVPNAEVTSRPPRAID